MIDKVQETHLYKWLCEKNSEFLGQVNEAIRYAETMLPLVSKVFADYTVHGIRHSINVMEYMFSLITDIDLLSDLEVVLLIYSALFHDIGMVTNENEINDIKSDNSVLENENIVKYLKSMEKRISLYRNALDLSMENAQGNILKIKWMKSCFSYLTQV